MNWKRIIPAAVAVSLVAGSLAGCGNKTTQSEQGNHLTYWKPFYAHYTQLVSNYGETPFYQEVQKRTNTELEFIHPAPGQEAEAFNLLMVSRDLPDIIDYSDGFKKVYKGGTDAAVKDGVILDLTDIIKEKAPNYSKVLASNPEWEKAAKTDSGKNTLFANIVKDKSMQFWQGLQIRMDYLEKINEERPETIDEWETVLTKFKTQLNLEFPLTLLDLASAQNGFGAAYGWRMDTFLKNGAVHYAATEPSYKDFLTLMNKWVNNGLLDPDFSTHDKKTFDSKVASGKAGAYLQSVGGGMGPFITSTKENNSEAKLGGVKYPVLVKGQEPIFGYFQNVCDSEMGTAITTACKNLDAAVRLLDYPYSEEGEMLYNFGTEGVSYEMVDGYPKYTELVTNNPDGLTMQQALVMYSVSSLGAPLHDPRYFEQFQQTPEQKEAVKMWVLSDTSWFMPPVTLSEEETAKVAAKKSEVETYIKEMSVKFIMGVEPLENFETYLETAKKMGVDEIVAAYQAAYERYQNR